MSVLKPVPQTDPHLSGRCACGFQVAVLSQQQLSPGSGARGSQPPRGGSGRHACVTLGHSGSREAQSQDSDFSIRPSEKQKSATQNPGSRFSPKRPSRVRAGEAGPRAAPPPPPLSSLGRLPSRPPLSYSRTCGMLFFQTVWLPLYTPVLVVGPLLFQPTLILVSAMTKQPLELKPTPAHPHFK